MTVVDRPVTARWRARRQSLFLYEIDADALAPHIDPSLELAETRPGIGLMAVECLHYHAGHFRPDHPESYEMVVAALVHPDLSLDMPLPKFSLQILNVVTDSRDFVARESELLGSPMKLLPGLHMQFTADGTSVDVTDGDRPVVGCKNIDRPPRYEQKVMWGLIYNTTRGLEHGVFRWEGAVHEHMHPGEWGRFHPHAAFAGIDTARVRGCYRRMSARPDATTDISYYHLGTVAPRSERQS